MIQTLLKALVQGASESFETNFFEFGQKKSVTERPPESICITYTNSETKKSFDFFSETKFFGGGGSDQLN